MRRSRGKSVLRAPRRAGGEKGVSVVGLNEMREGKGEGLWGRTSERARALACSTVCLARRGRVVQIWRK